MQTKLNLKQIQNYIVTTKVLGKGCFGTVFLGYFKEDKTKLLAVKQLQMKNIKGDLKLLKRQMDLLIKLDGPNIVKFYKPIRTESNLYFFLQYCQQDLKTYLKEKGGKLSEAQALTFFRQICQGFKILQQNNVIHRDIKPANILIHNGIAKITDFGFARVVDNVDEAVVLTFLGTPLYMSPQILSKQKFNSKCDIWSLGVTFYQMLYGKTPYTAKNPFQLLQNIRNQTLQFPANIPRSQQVKDLLKAMLVVDQQKRISWNDIFLHPLLVAPNIKEQLNEIKQSNLQSLQKSFKLNQFYVKANKVLGAQDNIEVFQSTQQEQNNMSAVQNIEQIKVLQEITQRVDKYIKYQRNVSIYINITTNQFFTDCKGIIPETLFFIGVFILQKYQLFNYQAILEIFSNKKQLSKFSSKEWEIYKKSHNYWKSLRAIKNDQKYLKPYFNEVYQKSKRFFESKNLESQFSQLYQIFKIEHSDALITFNIERFKKIIEYIAKYLEQEVQNSKHIVKSLRICKDPFSYFKEETDFNVFYEAQKEEEKKN